MLITITDIQLRKLVEDVAALASQNSVESTLAHLGLLSEWMRKKEAIKFLKSEATYQKALEKGMLHERKTGKGKNSPIVVLRKEVNHISKLCLSADF